MGNKIWTESEDKKMLVLFDELKNCDHDNYTDKEIFALMSEESERTPKAIEQRVYKLKSMGVETVTNDHNAFLEGLQDLKTSYETVNAQNAQLRKRVEELEAQLQDYQMMARIMEQARKIIVAEEMGPDEKPRFKMDQNGNLERQR